MLTTLEALGSRRRREIIRLIWTAELSAGEIAAAFDVSWAAISQNLRVLREVGAIRQRREGTRRYYQADLEALGPLAGVLEAMWTADLDALRTAVEADSRGRKRA